MEKPKSVWDRENTFTEDQLAEAERLAGTDLTLAEDTSGNGAEYQVQIPKVDSDPIQPEASQVETADAIINGQQTVKIINDGTTSERVVFPPLEGQELSASTPSPKVAPERLIHAAALETPTARGAAANESFFSKVKKIFK